MNLAYKSIVPNFNEEKDTQNTDQLSYNKYLLSKAKEIPDVWFVRDKYYENEEVTSVCFNKVSPILELYIKAFAYELLYHNGLEVESVVHIIRSVYRFIFHSYEDVHALGIESDYREGFDKYIEKLRIAVREKVFSMVATKTTALDNEKEGDNWLLSKKTALTYANQCYRFLVFLSSYSKKHLWIKESGYTKELPNKFSEYFSPDELQVFRSTLRDLSEENKANKAIPYSILYDVMKFVYSQPPSYIKTAIIIAAHTGLRISEIRGLQIDCLTKLSTTEIKSAKEYVKKIGGAVALKSDFSKSYWVSGHSIFKGKGKYPIEGAPILVGIQVKHAIDELISITADIREKSGSKYLFINNSSGKNTYGIRSYQALLNDRDAFVEQGMPFIRFHQFRATFATILYDLRVPIGMIEKYLNHIRSDVTAGYITSERKRDIDILNAILAKKIVGSEKDSAYIEFERALRSAVATAEFAGMTFSSQASFFRRMLKQYGIKVSLGDHGICVLPMNEVCSHGYENANPCHTSGCKKFSPNVDERDFFVKLIESRKKQKKEITSFAKQHGSAKIDLQRFDRDILNINNIINWIDKSLQGRENA